MQPGRISLLVRLINHSINAWMDDRWMAGWDRPLTRPRLIEEFNGLRKEMNLLMMLPVSERPRGEVIDP